METLTSFGALLAQTQPAADPSAVAVQSFWDFILKGGVMMIPIGLCSLVALAVIVERSVTLRRPKVIPPAFLDRIKQALRAGGRKQALGECESDGSPIARIFAAAIRRMGEPIGVLERHVEQAGQRVVFRMRKYLRVLSVIAAVTPLLGLLGTIFGMIRAFQTVATSAEALGRTEMLARGIYEAMITTAAGLSVAIPVLIGYHWVSAKIERLVVEMDMMVVDLVEDAVHPTATKEEATEPISRSDGHARTKPAIEVAPGDPAVAAGS